MHSNKRFWKKAALTVLVTLAVSIAVVSGCSQSGEFRSMSASSAGGSSASQSTSANNSSTQAASENAEWSAESAPNGYEVLGPADVSYSPKAGEYVYTGLDSLGRTKAAYANITAADYNRELGEDRESFGSDADKISGWGHNEKVSLTFPSGKIYNGYFYNRSHLIADSLGGSPARENLVTGSRFQNVGDNNGGGMGYAEGKARKWLASQTDPSASIYYSATPVYEGDELVPRVVIVDMKSSDGKIDERVKVYNVAGDDRYKIDYKTGEIEKVG